MLHLDVSNLKNLEFCQFTLITNIVSLQNHNASNNKW